MKKRMLSIACILTLALTLFAGTAVSAATADPLEATSYPLLNGIELGAVDKTDLRSFINPSTVQGDATVTAEAVESLTGASDKLMLSLNAETEQKLGVEFNNRTADNSAFEFVKGFDTDSTAAFMFYVKAPAAGENVSISLRLKTVPDEEVATGTERYLFVDANKPYYMLAKGTEEWISADDATVTDPVSGLSSFPVASGFEGWIRVPFTSFGAGFANGGDYIYDWLYNVGIDFSTVGSEAGAAVVGAPLVVTKDSDSTAIKLDGAEKPVDLFTGEEVTIEEPGEPEEPNPPTEDVDISGITAAKQFQFMKDMTVGEEIPMPGEPVVPTLPWIGLGSEIYRDDLSIKPVESLTGISDYPMLQIDTATPDADSITMLTPYSGTRQLRLEVQNLDKENWMDIGSANAFMFYVKMPEIPWETGFWFQLHVLALDENGEMVPDSENTLQLSKDAVYYTLAKGETQWQTSTASDLMYVGMDEGGFEGWVRIPFTSFQDNFYNQQDGVSYDQMYKLTIFCKELGGEYGAMTIGAPLIVTNSAFTGAAITVDDRGRIQNLFTGEDMDREEVFPPLKPGDEVLSLPEGTTDKELFYPDEGDITSTTAKLKWEAMEGAASYRLEVYQHSLSDSTMVYVFQKSYDVTGTEQVIDGLEANMRYSVVLRALDAEGTELGIYEPLAFSAADDAGGEVTPPVDDNDPDTDPSQPGDDDDNTPSDTDDEIPPTGDTSVVPALMVAVLAAALLVILRQAKMRGKA